VDRLDAEKVITDFLTSSLEKAKARKGHGVLRFPNRAGTDSQQILAVRDILSGKPISLLSRWPTVRQDLEKALTLLQGLPKSARQMVYVRAVSIYFDDIETLQNIDFQKDIYVLQRRGVSRAKAINLLLESRDLDLCADAIGWVCYVRGSNHKSLPWFESNLRQAIAQSPLPLEYIRCQFSLFRWERPEKWADDAYFSVFVRLVSILMPKPKKKGG
jgi:hypothetical protein